jgi:hypothetical protein
MKTKNYFLLVCVVFFSLAGCSSCDNEPPTVSASPKSIEFEAGIDNEVPKNISITTNADSWEIYNQASDWLKADKGDEKSLSVLPIKAWTNTKEGREAQILVKAENKNGTAYDTVTVRQKAKVKDVLSISPNELSFAAAETGEKIVAVTTTGPGWSASKPYDATWLSIEKAGNGLIVKVPSPNTQNTQRLTFITFNGEGDADVVELAVRQAAAVATNPTLSVTPATLSIGADDTAQKTLTVTTNQPSWSSSSGATWLNVSTSGNTALVSATKNTTGSARNATITFTAGSATPVTVAVTQAKESTPDTPGLCFGNMPAGSYRATGTPKLAQDPGPSSWTGSVSINCSPAFYMITNWAGSGKVVFCDYKNGKIIMDSEFEYVIDSSISAYFMAIVINTSTSTWAQLENYEARYNTSTKKLDFSGTYSGLPVIVGVIAINTATDELVGVIGDAYSNTVLTLTPSSSSPAPATGNGVLKAEAARQAQGNLKITPFEGNQTFRKANK